MSIIITDTEIQGASRSFPTMRNKLLNGNFWINQLVLSGTVNLAAGAYGHDGWKAGAAGCQYTFAASGNDAIITIISGTLVQTVGSDYIHGGAHCLSWAGTAQGRLVSGAGLSGPFTASPFTIGNLQAAVVATVEFGVGTLSYVQLEEGLYPRVFERKEPREEFRRAKRYFRTSYPAGVAIGTGSQFLSAWRAIAINTSQIISLQLWEDPMIAIPVMAIYNSGTGALSSVRNTVSGAAVALSAAGSPTTQGMYNQESSSAFTTGALYDFHYTAAARL